MIRFKMVSLGVTPKRSSKGKLETRSIFISHAHADRDLALKLREAIEEAFSGLVTAFISSDPTPTGGIMPGDEWYNEIHAQLQEAEAVWVLVTPVSLYRPWVYWEAGIGKASCPGGVVVLRAGVKANELLSPLSNFQAYDALLEGADGVGELLGKVATKIGMTIPKVLLDDVAKRFVEDSKNHHPLEGEPQLKEIKLGKEQLDSFGAILARLETAIDSMRVGGSTLEAPVPRRRASTIERLFRGLDGSVYDSLSDFTAALESVPAEATLDFRDIDRDGDAGCSAVYGIYVAIFYLRGSALPTLDTTIVGQLSDKRIASILSDILAARDKVAREPAEIGSTVE